MRITQLIGFAEIAQCRSFSKAAKALYVSQSTLTQQLAALERELGMQLLDRTSRKVELTVAGDALLPDVQQILRDLDNALKNARHTAGLELTNIAIGCSDVLIQTLSQVLKSYVAKHPEQSFSIDIATPNECLIGLERGDFDVAFITADDCEGKQGIHYEPLVDIEYSCAVSTNRDLGSNGVLSWDEIAGEHIIVPSGKFFSQFYSGLVARLKSEFPGISIEELDDFRLTRTYVVLGKGVSITPLSPTDKDKGDIRFVRLEPAHKSTAGFAWISKSKARLNPGALANDIKRYNK